MGPLAARLGSALAQAAGLRRFRMQHGHRGSLVARAAAIVVRSVDIEFGVWRSGRSGAARAVAFVV